MAGGGQWGVVGRPGGGWGGGAHWVSRLATVCLKDIASTIYNTCKFM